MTREEEAGQNTDKEIWRERPDDYYSDSIHVTQTGGIGINVGGTVFVRPVREWHGVMRRLDEADKVIEQLREALEPFLDHDCENPARCRMMRSLNQGAVLCRICEAQAALAAGKES